MSEQIRLAHSAEGNIIEPQSYHDHVMGVYTRAMNNVERLCQYVSPDLADVLRYNVAISALYHDMGKLSEENQDVLSGKKKANHLPFKHWDAGAQYLIKKGMSCAPWIVDGHHRGLSSAANLKARECRTDDSPETIDDTDKNLERYVKEHNRIIPEKMPSKPSRRYFLSPMDMRMVMSCLVDADYGDTAAYYNGIKKEDKFIDPRFKERLDKLKRLYYEKFFSEKDKSLRNQLRWDFFHECCNAPLSNLSESLLKCDGAVGIGKTLAMMVLALRIADEYNLRHIFIILPYTSIITQSVKEYRKYIVLDGENQEDIISEIHHQADFSSVEARELASLWKAPVIVTTSVAFASAITGNKPSVLRKLHELPGSCIVSDESHMFAPAWMMPFFLKQFNCFRKDYSSRFILTSGSMLEFFESKKFMGDNVETVKNVISQELRTKIYSADRKRIVNKLCKKLGLSKEELYKLIKKGKGPRIVIFNTKWSAAVFAQYLREQGEDVLHVSNVFCSDDKIQVIEKIKEKLKHDTDWYLVATSCVECGMDFSFRSGWKEISSLCSMIQAGGRVNRNDESDTAELNVFQLRYGDDFKKHPSFEKAAMVLERFFKEGKIKQKDLAKLVTEAAEEELSEESTKVRNEMIENENRFQFEEVSKQARIIDTDTRCVVVDKELIARLERGEYVSRRKIMSKSVQLWVNEIKKLSVEPIRGYESKTGDESDTLYKWVYEYDPEFLGYMAGALEIDNMNNKGVKIF